MKTNWIFWLIRIVIYAVGVALFIWQYNENKDNPARLDTLTTIGEIAGITILLFELLLMFVSRKRKRADNH